MNLPRLPSLCGDYHALFDALKSACLKCIPPCLRRHHQVLPEHFQHDHCEFLQLHPQRKIRVLHYNSVDVADGTEESNVVQEPNPHEDGTLDDYWFLRGSHSSFRILKKKNRAADSKANERGPDISRLSLQGARYSFHRKQRLKPCNEEEDVELTNQKNSVDSLVNSLVSSLLAEAVADAVRILRTKHQRSIKTTPDTSATTFKIQEPLPQPCSPGPHGDVTGSVNQGFDLEEGSTTVENGPEIKNGGKDSIPEASVRKKSQEMKDIVNKPLLLFLHGAGSSAEVWSPLLTYFAAAGFEVVAPDLLGHGLSSAPRSARAYTFPCLLQDALQIFDTFVAEPRKCVVIGHGYGCSFAAAVARYRPQSVVQLVLISGGGPTPLAPRRGTYALPRFLLGCAKPLLLCGFRREYFYAARGKQLVLEEGCSGEVPRYVMSNMRKGQVWPQGDAAFHRRVQVPTLLVHGMTDPYITLVEQCEMERTIPRSFLEVVPGAGHWAMTEVPQQMCHMLHCFIILWDKAGALSK